jgi:hypothetical protein
VTAAQTESTPVSVVAHIRACLPALTTRGRRIGQTILDNPLDVIHLTVTDLAERTETSVATVVRFCQDVGLRGFADLKIRLAAETIPPERGLHEDVLIGDPPATILNKVLASTATAVTGAADTVNPAAFAMAVALLRDARQILCVGVGTSAPLTQDAAYRFRTAGLPAEAPHDAHVQHVTARLMGSQAVCLCFSHTGQTRVAQEALYGGCKVPINSTRCRSPVVPFRPGTFAHPFRRPAERSVNRRLIWERDARVDDLASRRMPAGLTREPPAARSGWLCRGLSFRSVSRAVVRLRRKYLCHVPTTSIYGTVPSSEPGRYSVMTTSIPLTAPTNWCATCMSSVKSRQRDASVRTL